MAAAARLCVLASIHALILGDALKLKDLQEPIQSQSQFGQDKWVASKHPQPGYFVDIGAFHGKYGSNSWALEQQRQWHGLCIEPVPKDFAGRSCKLLQVAVSNHNGTATFRKCSDPQLSGLSEDAKTYRDDCSDVPVIIRSTRNLLLENLPADVRVIDYVSLDVEGTELKVLQDWPFERACVRLWTIEHNNQVDKMPISQFLTSKGCTVQDVSVDWWAECPCS